MLKALIFDCDGVLVDTERDGHRVSFNEAFARAGLKTEWSVERYGELLLTAGGKDGVCFTFSDLTQRLLPTLILDAYPDKPVRFERAVEILRTMKPTPRFRESKPS